MYIHLIYPNISRMKFGIRRTPPPRLLAAQKIRGGVYSTWSGGIFLRNFWPNPPPNIPGLKGGGCVHVHIHTSSTLTSHLVILDDRSRLRWGWVGVGRGINVHVHVHTSSTLTSRQCGFETQGHAQCPSLEAH